MWFPPKNATKTVTKDDDGMMQIDYTPRTPAKGYKIPQPKTDWQRGDFRDVDNCPNGKATN